MTIISPSILSANFMQLGAELENLKPEKDVWIHLDVMDGHFVPNLTFGPTVIKNIKKHTEHKLDAHFMVNNPEDHALWFSELGLYNFTFHWEAVTHHDSLIQKLKALYPSVGVSLNPSTPTTIIPDYLYKQINLVLVMSVNPGFGGQSFIEGALEKIHELDQIKKRLNLDFEIQVDGGVSDKNAQKIIKAGATNLVAGSFVFNEPNSNYSGQIKKLRG
ncbi:MAG: ribulose-phosphate 3-epimerase [Halobacteriovoraceae bacterium]|nr:ribulose-phosphate 3-epimerase [Halobacteriovoraceae bacterium]|tara:strand:- start:27028 stop:27681 length:654 start_codon:yes stop_codon:yes gene_type:complete